MYTYILSILDLFNDAIAQLSDQVMALTARMQEFERKQQPYVHIYLSIDASTAYLKLLLSN